MDWLSSHENLLHQLGTLSLILLLVTVVVLPIAVAKLPEDYFEREKREPASSKRKHPLLWGIISLLKNVLGLLMILAGLVMLVLPGQGTVAILVGVAMTNFPGKYKLQRRIASQPAVLKTLNKVRELAKEPPFQMPAEPQKDPSQGT
jgi:hypothetical protein